MCQWMAIADREIQEHYAENHAKARDPRRIQQTGHAAERAWGQLLERWLPPQCLCVKKLPRSVHGVAHADGAMPVDGRACVLDLHSRA
jgi:hypothetical protein